MMLPWITTAEMLKGRLFKVEIYYQSEMLCIKYCTVDSFNPESYWNVSSPETVGPREDRLPLSR